MPYTVLDSSTAAAAPATLAGTPLTSVGETLTTIRAEVWAQLQNRSDVVPAGDYTRLDRWIKWGYINVAQMLDLTELWASVALVVVANQPFYNLPASVSWIKRILIEDPTDFSATGGSELDLIDEPAYRMLPDSSALSPGNPTIPQAYFRYARMAVLWPTPSIAFSLPVDFRVRPLPLVNPTDSPILPQEFHEGIIYAALERAQFALHDYQKSAISGNMKLNVIRPLLNTDGEERTAMNIRMVPVRSVAQLKRRWRTS